MISPFPPNAALLIANLSQPSDEVIDARSAREGQNCFDVSDTIEPIKRRREHLARIGRSDQRICFVGMSKEPARKKVDAATNGMDVLRFRQKLRHAPPVQISWLRTLHANFILARAFDFRPPRSSPRNPAAQAARRILRHYENPVCPPDGAPPNTKTHRSPR